MATAAVGLPPGFELEAPPAAPPTAGGLPPGFELEAPPAAAPPAAAPSSPAHGALTALMSIPGGAELLLHHITGALAPIPGMVAGSAASVGKLFGANVDPNKVQADTENALTYAPVTESGQAGLRGEQQIAAPVRQFAKPVTDKVTQAIDAAGPAAPYIRAAGKGALLAAGFAAPGAAKTAGELASEALLPERAAVEGAAKPVVGTGKTAVETGRSAGFQFTPGGVESRMPAEALKGEVPQSSAVTPNDRRTVVLRNQAKATELAGEQIGKKGATSLSPKDYASAQQPHFDTYKATGDTVGSGLTGSDNFQSALSARLADDTQTKLPGPVASQAQRILKAASSGNLSGPGMVKDISWMRANGGRSVAKLLEDEMETQLGTESPQLAKFRDARTGLAQIRNLQELTKGGQVDASGLARLDAKYPGLLTGNLKLIAQSAAASPQDFRLPSGVKPGSSPLSKPTLLGAAKGVVGKIAKTVAPSRFDVTSDAFQNRFGREGTPTENSYRRDLGKRPAAPSEAFALQPPPGTPGVSPVQLGMEVAQGRPAAPGLELKPPEGTTGVSPVQLGMEVAQGRPLAEQRLQLAPTQGTIEPHQPSLLGHPGTPEGGGPKGKVKRRGVKKD